MKLLDRIVVHRRVTPSIKFASGHSYTWVERDTVRKKNLAQEHSAMFPATAQPAPLDPETSALTMRPPRFLRHSANKYFNNKFDLLFAGQKRRKRSTCYNLCSSSDLYKMRWCARRGAYYSCYWRCQNSRYYRVYRTVCYYWRCIRYRYYTRLCYSWCKAVSCPYYG